MEQNNLQHDYDGAVTSIKSAILQSQHQALRMTNKVMLALYFSIGRYISHNSRHGFWNTGALDVISKRLHQELPGLRGFSATSLKMMRIFYEQWEMLDDKSSTTVDDLRIGDKSKSSTTANDLRVASNAKSSTMVDDLEMPTFLVPHNDDYVNFPLEEYLHVPFSHHYIILSKVKDIRQRIFYIRLCAREHLSRAALTSAIAHDEYAHRGALPNNFLASLTPAEQARKAVLAFKDEYVLDFINVEQLGARDIEDVDERVVENKIVHNIRNFIMKFGADFAFLGNQYRVEAL